MSKTLSLNANKCRPAAIAHVPHALKMDCPVYLFNNDVSRQAFGQMPTGNQVSLHERKWLEHCAVLSVLHHQKVPLSKFAQDWETTMFELLPQDDVFPLQFVENYVRTQFDDASILQGMFMAMQHARPLKVWGYSDGEQIQLVLVGNGRQGELIGPHPKTGELFQGNRVNFGNTKGVLHPVSENLAKAWKDLHPLQQQVLYLFEMSGLLDNVLKGKFASLDMIRWTST
jgi:hypothetical protein